MLILELARDFHIWQKFCSLFVIRKARRAGGEGGKRTRRGTGEREEGEKDRGRRGRKKGRGHTSSSLHLPSRNSVPIIGPLLDVTNFRNFL
jgi:hypothetical protein